MKHKATFSFVILILQFCSFLANGQNTSLLKKISLLEEPVSVSIDRSDHIYVGGGKGNVYKYNKSGELLFTYSPQKPGNIKSIEAWSTLNTFLFYEGLQEFSFLDRFLTLLTTQKLANDVYARLATISSDNNIWVFDDQDYALKKINLNYFEPEILTSLTNVVGSDFQGSHLREYQNFVFLSDGGKGIYVFDNFGNFIKKLPFNKISYFNFYKNELYFLNNSTITFYDIYTTESRFVEIETDEKYIFALFADNMLCMVSKSSLDIYSLKN